MVVELLTREVGEDVADRPPRAPGRAIPAHLAEGGEAAVEPLRLGVEYVERVEILEQVRFGSHTQGRSPATAGLTERGPGHA